MLMLKNNNVRFTFKFSSAIIDVSYRLANDSDLSRSPPGAYTSNPPPSNRDGFPATDKPPVLPPHLLNVILNKDTAPHVGHPFCFIFNRI